MLAALGWSERWQALLGQVAEEGAVPGRVVRHDSSQVVVTTAEGTRSLPVRTGGENPVVGDWVAVSADAVVAVLDRTSLLRRRQADADVEQALAANVDLVFIVCGLDRPVRSGRVHRVVTLAWDAGATPVVVLTKADLVEDTGPIVDELQDAAPALEVVVVSARRGEGIDRIRELAHERTVVLFGESGAGKSTLVNTLVGEEVAATGEVRSGDAKGRHTTTTRQLHPLPGGGVLLDSPGIRAVGLWVDPEAVSATFPDIEAHAESCRFSDCSHETEPGCAVTAAVDAGEISTARFRAWRDLRQEADAMAKADHERRRSGRRGAKAMREVQRRRNPD
jgi:ribosome biogenesis GTPase / thiamine phosphate phosphatase